MSSKKWAAHRRCSGSENGQCLAKKIGWHIVVVPAMQERRQEEVAFSAQLDYRHATGDVMRNLTGARLKKL